MPGYGAGAAFYWRNLAPLASCGFRCYAVDWLGTGLSGRPPFGAATHDDAVAFFLDALEAWRDANGLDRFSLVGHSLGGYLAARYALAHPERVERLVLAGPAAIAARPGPPPDSLWFRALAAAWDGGVTPGSVVRCFGPAAPGHAAFYVEKRFRDGAGLTKAEQGAFGSYVYHTLAQEGSGEFALPKLLAPGAWAREPLLPALAALRAPVTFIYGERDWCVQIKITGLLLSLSHPTALLNRMDWRAGKAAAQHVRTQAGQSAELVRVPGAGHYVMIDQPESKFEPILLCDENDQMIMPCFWVELTCMCRAAQASMSMCGARCVVIQGSDERARGEVLIKDLVLGATLSSAPDREAYLKAQAEAQFAVAETAMLDGVRKVLARG